MITKQVIDIVQDYMEGYITHKELSEVINALEEYDDLKRTVEQHEEELASRQDLIDDLQLENSDLNIRLSQYE